MANTKNGQVMVLSLDKDSVRRGLKTEDAVILHENDRGEGLLTAFGYAYGKMVGGDWVDFDSYEKEFTSKGVYNLTQEQVAALKKETPGTDRFNEIIDEIREGENLEDLYQSMSLKSRAMMEGLLGADEKVARAEVDDQRERENSEYKKFVAEHEKEQDCQMRQADEKLLKFFDEGR